MNQSVSYKERSPSRSHSLETSPIYQSTSERYRGDKKFSSSASLSILIVFFLLLRSSAGPFLGRKGEAKKSRSSFFFNFTCFLYIWIASVTLVTLIPEFSTHYNGVIATSLFFPMTFSSIALLLLGRLLVRLVLYVLIKCGVIKFTNQQQNMERKYKDEQYDLRRILDFNEKKMKRRRLKEISLLAFHRPFRKVAMHAVRLSLTLCVLYAHCWSRTMSLFKVSSDDEAGALCKIVFSVFAEHSEQDNDKMTGAHANSIWMIWLSAISIMVLSFAQDEWNGLRCNVSDGDKTTYFGRTDKALGKENSNVVNEKNTETMLFPKDFVEDCEEHPKETLEMVPWLSLFAASCVKDIILQSIIFDGRVDGRAMQSALHSSSSRTEKLNRFETNHHQSDEEKFRNLQCRYEGCIFDYSSNLKVDSSGGFWFDYMADCGDGFNSSYQVARMLAQPVIGASKNGKLLQLPRGSLLINGGDLAYPNPSESSYENRFFRTFEDAMQPPPSFRRSKISVMKPDLPVEGWQNCFHEPIKDKRCNYVLHESYKGPSSFVLPGNHDWYDGLATYTRFILCRDWLGGWLLPQKRSYFSIKLAKGWWVFGMDCALNSDIDIEQYKFFANIADTLIGPNDAVILVNHVPHWVTDCEEGKSGHEASERNIRELMQSHLRGKVRLRLAGDLHHYTRHTPEKKIRHHKKRGRSRSFSFDETTSAGGDSNLDTLKPFIEENRPDLVVSGGGGAFLHLTHNHSKNITFGGKRYRRVCAYPSERQSYLIGAMNLIHFRSRNYRADWVMALVYFGLVASLFPLCGIYSDYEAFNPDHDFSLMTKWCFQKIASLIWRVLTSENVSLFWSGVVIVGAVGLQSPDKKMNPFLRLFWALIHGITHIVAALLCLLFVQSVTEWVIQDEIVKISINNQHYNGTNLASSLYENYQTHFYPVLENFTHPDFSTLAYYAGTKQQYKIIVFLQPFLQLVLQIWKWIYTALPLLKTTMSIFDLPGIVARYHHDICSSLCADGLECLLTHDKYRFLSIERTSYVKYMIAITLYFICTAIPLAGGIFGTWLTISSNIFKSQGDLSASALMVEHWKNFLKLNIKSNGDLQVFAVGLQKVPMSWIKDKNWDGHKSKEIRQKPTWTWEKPSKWIAAKESTAYQPQIVDYTCIRRRQIITNSGYTSDSS